MFCTLLDVFFMFLNFFFVFAIMSKKCCRVLPVFKNCFRYLQTHIPSCVLVYRSQKVYSSWKKLSWIFVLSLTLVQNASNLAILSILRYEFWYANIPQWFHLCSVYSSPGRQFFSNTIHFSNHFAPLRCSKIIIFAHFVLFQKIDPKNDAEWCRDLRT